MAKSNEEFEAAKQRLKNQPKPLKLEVGKQYVRRDGEVTDPLQPNRSAVYPFRDDLYSYTPDGLQSIGIETEHDLISEAYIDSGKGTTFHIVPSDPNEHDRVDPIQQMQDELIPTRPTEIGQLPIDAQLNKQKANDIQHGGSHYKKAVIQPWDYIARNNIPYLEGSAIKYISRWRDKGGIEDLKKAIHFIEKVIELEQEKNNETKTT